MFNVKWCAAVLLLFVGIATASAAVRLKGLYEAGVDVPNQSKEARSQALQEALREVFVRISGTQNFEQIPALEKALNSAGQYAQQYRYRQKTVPGTTEGTQPLSLWVRFDGRAVERLLHKNGLPVWGRERPVTLVWLAVDEGQNRYVVSADGDGDLRAELEAEAHRRGLPLLFPIMDLEDQRHLAFADIWGGFADTIQAASVRYNPEAILVGRLHHTSDGNWSARWSLYNQKQESHWASNGHDRPLVMAFGVDGAADALASRYAMRVGEEASAEVDLVVNGVQTLQDYARVSKYLSSFAFLSQANVTRVGKSQVTYSLDIQGTPSGLVQAIALGNVLEPGKPEPNTNPAAPTGTGDPAAAPPPPGPTVLTYRLLP